MGAGRSQVEHLSCPGKRSTQGPSPDTSWAWGSTQPLQPCSHSRQGQCQGSARGPAPRYPKAEWGQRASWCPASSQRKCTSFISPSACFPGGGKRVRPFCTPRSLNRETPNLFTVGSHVINVGLSLSLHFRLEREADLFPPLMGLRRQKPGGRQGWWHEPRDGADRQARAVESA